MGLVDQGILTRSRVVVLLKTDGLALLVGTATAHWRTPAVRHS